MNKKQLENYFFEYQKQHEKTFTEEGDSAVIYNSKEFHINIKNKTIYINNLGIIPLPQLEENMETPDWVAITIQEGKSNLVMGTGNPYTSEYVDVLPNENGIIVALPCSILTKQLSK